MKGEQVVWQFNYKKEEGKSYFHPVTIGGGPTLTDLRPADHIWHRVGSSGGWQLPDGLDDGVHGR
ncbi:MAG TPA: DUF6807 family protein [Planctomycetota bacterium]